MDEILLKDFKKYVEIVNNGIEGDVGHISPTTYLPLILETEFSYNLGKNDILKKIDYVDNSVSVTNDILANLSVPSFNVSSLKFIFHELIGNIYDHSNFRNAFVMGSLEN